MACPALPNQPAEQLLLTAHQLANTLEKLGINYWYKEPVKTADKAASNHGISAMKFQLIRVSKGSVPSGNGQRIWGHWMASSSLTGVLDVGHRYVGHADGQQPFHWHVGL